MQVRVRIRGGIIVDDDVYSLDIDTTTEDIGGNKDTFFESLERGITSDTKQNYQVSSHRVRGESNVPFLLSKTRVDTDTRKIARNKQLVQFNRPCDGFHEDDNLLGGFA